MTYSEAVKELIYKHGFGPMRVARELGIASQAVTGWFSEGKNVPKSRDLQLAKIFQVDPLQLRQGKIVPIGDRHLSAEGGVDIDPKIIRNLLDKSENKQMLGLWIGMDFATQLNTLEIMRVIARMAAKNVA